MYQEIQCSCRWFLKILVYRISCIAKIENFSEVYRGSVDSETLRPFLIMRAEYAYACSRETMEPNPQLVSHSAGKVDRDSFQRVPGTVEGPFTRVTRRFLHKLSRDDARDSREPRRLASLSYRGQGRGTRTHTFSHRQSRRRRSLAGEYLQEVKQKEIPPGRGAPEYSESIK